MGWFSDFIADFTGASPRGKHRNPRRPARAVGRASVPLPTKRKMGPREYVTQPDGSRHSERVAKGFRQAGWPSTPNQSRDTGYRKPESPRARFSRGPRPDLPAGSVAMARSWDRRPRATGEGRPRGMREPYPPSRNPLSRLAPHTGQPRPRAGR